MSASETGPLHAMHAADMQSSWNTVNFTKCFYYTYALMSLKRTTLLRMTSVISLRIQALKLPNAVSANCVCTRASRPKTSSVNTLISEINIYLVMNDRK